MKLLNFPLSKRANIIEPPQELLEDIFNWAKGIMSRYILEDKNLKFDSVTGKEITKREISKLRDGAFKYAKNGPKVKKFKIDQYNWKYKNLFPKGLVITILTVPWESPNAIATTYLDPFKAIVLYYNLASNLNIMFMLLREAIAHELIHWFQTVAYKFGFPQKNHIRSDEDLEQSEYDQQEAEFYPLLFGEAKLIEDILDIIDEKDQRIAFKTLIGQNKGFSYDFLNETHGSVEPSPWLVFLKDDNVEKWKKAVKQIYSYLKGIGFKL